jgi:Flp pilus assembly protein TadD
VFELTVRSFPQSANAHDSLGEAYERAGRRDAAIAEYRKAISLDANAESPRAALRRLGVPPLSS